MFRVVVFCDTNEVEVISEEWWEEGPDSRSQRSKGFAWWPPRRHEIDIDRLRRCHRSPDPNTWRKYQARSLYTTDDPLLARQKSRKAQITSDLASTCEDDERSGRRRRRRVTNVSLSPLSGGSDDERLTVAPPPAPDTLSVLSSTARHTQAFETATPTSARTPASERGASRRDRRNESQNAPAPSAARNQALETRRDATPTSVRSVPASERSADIWAEDENLGNSVHQSAAMDARKPADDDREQPPSAKCSDVCKRTLVGVTKILSAMEDIKRSMANFEQMLREKDHGAAEHQFRRLQTLQDLKKLEGALANDQARQIGPSETSGGRFSNQRAPDS